MKKGLYIAFEFEYKPDLMNGKYEQVDGIEKKIYFQYKTFESYGYNMKFYNPYLNRKHSIERILRRLPLHYLNKWKFDYMMIQDIDFLYIRKMWFMDGDLIIFLKKVKRINNKVKVILEIPTYPYDNEGKKIDMIPLKIKDKKWRNKLYEVVDRIVTYSDDEEIFNIKTIKTSNAIDISSTRRHAYMAPIDKINMIACGSLYYWHGFDRAIEGLHNYYMQRRDDIVELYIVGKGAESVRYKELIKKYDLGKHVFLVGAKYNDELDAIYDKCSVGLDSMGRHRSGITYNSSLKGKEYCAKGLMIISGVKTELDNEEEYPYYYRVPADESPIDFEKYVNNYKRLLTHSSLNDIQKEIQKFAEKRYDFKVAMQPIKEFIE